MKPASHPTKRWAILGSCVAAVGLWAAAAWADQIVHKDGRRLDGRIAKLAGMTIGANAKASKDEVPIESIVMIDDDLRRTYIPTRQIQEVLTPPSDPVERFLIKQPVISSRDRFGAVGQFFEVTPFDSFGRRRVTMRGMKDDRITATQGITVLTPQWTKIEAVGVQARGVQWEQRIATSGIPLDQLDAVLAHMVQTAAEKDRVNMRLAVVRFYLQANLVRKAEDRLKELIAEFPTQAAEFQPLVVRLRQMFAQQALNEIRTRGEAGQFQFSQQLLKQFPTENVAGQVLQGVAQLQADYQEKQDRLAKLLKQFDADLEKLPTSKYRPAMTALRDEIKTELTLNTLPRLAAYEQFLDDETLTVEDRLALAASGWLIGSADAVRKLADAASLYDVRNLARQYLSEPIWSNRLPIVDAIRGQEGGAPERVAKLLGHMKPPLERGEEIADQPLMYQREFQTMPGKPAGTYLIQLPPEYDPLRVYPTIVTLHGGGSTPQTQIDWWAGPRLPKSMRLGQATRHGYIVIAPQWSATFQDTYKYTALEHRIVLGALEDASRRFSIDSDRVFLTGHSMGGDAAWDIGISHPDRFAGVIPITAVGDRYVLHNPDHIRYLPMYFVSGELDANRSTDIAVHYDRYFNRARNANITIVEFQGRGHEHFSDEIIRLFDWMSRYRRTFPNKDFLVKSMRTTDDRFWWVELAKFPGRTIVEPESWPPPPGTQPAVTEAKITATNGIYVKSGAANVSVYLSPAMVDFDKKIPVSINGATLRSSTPGGYIKPDVAVMLEDARTRVDRLNPFWAKVEMPGNKVNLAGK